MDRREFLKKAGIGSVALASLAAVPALVRTLAETALAAGQTNFVLITATSRVGGSDLIILNGAGKFNKAQVEGGGSFTHFDAVGSPPFPILGSGTWKAKRLVSFTPTSPATYGGHAGGVLEMDVHLVPTVGSVIPATLKVVCNIPPGAMDTGQPEGTVLTIPALSATFGPSGPVAATLFSTGVESRD